MIIRTFVETSGEREAEKMPDRISPNTFSKILNRYANIGESRVGTPWENNGSEHKISTRYFRKQMIDLQRNTRLEAKSTCDSKIVAFLEAKYALNVISVIASQTV